MLLGRDASCAKAVVTLRGVIVYSLQSSNDDSIEYEVRGCSNGGMSRYYGSAPLWRFT